MRFRFLAQPRTCTCSWGIPFWLVDLWFPMWYNVTYQVLIFCSLHSILMYTVYMDLQLSWWGFGMMYEDEEFTSLCHSRFSGHLAWLYKSQWTLKPNYSILPKMLENHFFAASAGNWVCSLHIAVFEEEACPPLFRTHASTLVCHWQSQTGS